MPSPLPGNMMPVLSSRRWLTLSPGAVDTLKLIALMAMLVDHANTILMPVPRMELYALGRAAFPLFTLIWALQVTRAPERLQIRANRLWIWAVLTQPVFSLAFQGKVPWYALNILFVFAAATQLLSWYHRNGTRGLIPGIALIMFLMWPLMPASYGLPGMMLALSLAIGFSDFPFPGKQALGAVAFCSLLMLNGATHLLDNTLGALVFAIIPTLLLPAVAVSMATGFCQDGTSRFMPRSFFYVAYAGHLAILLTLHQFV